MWATAARLSTLRSSSRCSSAHSQAAATGSWRRARCDGPLDVLGLPALAVRGDDEGPRDGVGRSRAQACAHEMEAGVEPGGRPGRGEDVAVVDVERRGVDSDARVPGGQLVDGVPVRDGAAAVQETGVGDDHRPEAQTDDCGPAGVSLGEQPQERRAGGAAVGEPRGDDDHVGRARGAHALDAGHRVPLGGAHAAGASENSTVDQSPRPCRVTSSKTIWGTARWNIVMSSKA